MAKIVVAIKPTNSTSGASGVSRYIAESKRDKEKEGLKEKDARPLFSAQDDNLTYWQADQMLGKSTGLLPEKDNVAHLVISLEPDDFKALGETQEERKEAFRELIRETANEIEKETNIDELNWIAGIHLNTDNPHVHLAFSRDALDRDSHECTSIKHIPKTLLPHNEKTPNGTKEFLPGRIAEIISQGIERKRDILRTHQITNELTRLPGDPSHNLEPQNQTPNSNHPHATTHSQEEAEHETLPHSVNPDLTPETLSQGITNEPSVVPTLDSHTDHDPPTDHNPLESQFVQSI